MNTICAPLRICDTVTALWLLRSWDIREPKKQTYRPNEKLGAWEVQEQPVHLQVEPMQHRAHWRTSLNGCCLLYIENNSYMSHCRQEKSIFTNGWVVCLISRLLSLFLCSVIVDLLEPRLIGAAMRGDGVHLISRSYDRRWPVNSTTWKTGCLNNISLPARLASC